MSPIRRVLQPVDASVDHRGARLDPVAPDIFGLPTAASHSLLLESDDSEYIPPNCIGDVYGLDA